MFNWIKNIWKDYKKYQYQKELAEYYNYIDTCFSKNKNEVIGNFSYEGYKHIYEKLIGEAKYKIYIFCESYNKIFTEELFPLFKLKANSGIPIVIITCKNNEKFNDLSNTYTNIRYHVVQKIKDKPLSNFIVVDEKSYWIDDHKWFIRDNFEKLKAATNFSDYIYSSKLINICKTILNK